MRRFVEEELVIPTGPFAGRRFRCDRQPFTGLWFDAIDSGRWRRFAHSGGVQGGKTLNGSVAPLMYHLFEVGEKVIYGVPTLDMVRDKWLEDILPAIQASRYRDLLPRSGEGSRGGNVESRVTFGNGATLKFMTGGSGDKGRAGFTSRVVVVTEVDGMDTAGGGSREADKITQLEARTTAFGDRARVYLECTVSTEAGRIWQEIVQGTDSRIALRCPFCRAYVTPERQHLVGWQDAPDLAAAKDRARLACPGCGETWDDGDRRDANADAVLVHRGQKIDAAGAVTGDAPRTETLGFRWTAANNLLLSLGYVAAKEWRAARDPDAENSDTACRQFLWTLPREDAAGDGTKLDAHAIAARVTGDPRGRVPSGAERVVVAVDVGKWRCHWVALALFEDGRRHAVEYGQLQVPSDELGQEAALTTALREFRDGALADGWESDAGRVTPDVVLADSGWLTETVYGFCRESPGWFPAKGFAAAQYRRPYRAPRGKDRTVAFVGDGYHLVRMPAKGVRLFDCNADRWKSAVHDGLLVPPAAAGAITLYKAAAADHLTLGKHLTAERQTRSFEAGVGEVVAWEALSRNNHYFDAFGLALVAAAYAAAAERRDEGGEKRTWFARRKR